jgi:hypothetical protein
MTVRSPHAAVEIEHHRPLGEKLRRTHESALLVRQGKCGRFVSLLQRHMANARIRESCKRRVDPLEGFRWPLLFAEASKLVEFFDKGTVKGTASKKCLLRGHEFLLLSDRLEARLRSTSKGRLSPLFVGDRVGRQYRMAAQSRG